jgi:hypothetical protein
MKNESVLPICPILEFISTKATISKNACQTSAMCFWPDGSIEHSATLNQSAMMQPRRTVLLHSLCRK